MIQSKLEEEIEDSEGKVVLQREAERADWRKIKVFMFFLYISLKVIFNIFQASIKIIFNKFLFQKKKIILRKLVRKVKYFF